MTKITESKTSINAKACDHKNMCSPNSKPMHSRHFRSKLCLLFNNYQTPTWRWHMWLYSIISIFSTYYSWRVDVLSMYVFHSSILMKMTIQKYRKIEQLQRNQKDQWTNNTQYIIKPRKPQSNHDTDSKFMKKTHHTESKFNLKNKNPQNKTNPIETKVKRFNF